MKCQRCTWDLLILQKESRPVSESEPTQYADDVGSLGSDLSDQDKFSASDWRQRKWTREEEVTQKSHPGVPHPLQVRRDKNHSC